MKKVTLTQLLLMLGIVLLVSKVKAQSQAEAILVPTYQDKSEMPAKMKPEHKLLRQLPKVVVYENTIDTKLFKTQLNDWVKMNPVVLSQLEKSVIDLINREQIDELAQILIEMSHTIEIAEIKNEGGNHE
jgi:hypothetical protein